MVSLSERVKVIEDTTIELERLSQDEEAQMLYEAREKALKDKNTSIHGAIREVAINLMRMGLSDNQISEGTKLPIEEIGKIRAKLNRA